MGSRNGTVDSAPWYLGDMPVPLREICVRYQIHRRHISFQYAIRELLETHPAIVREIEMLYAEQST